MTTIQSSIRFSPATRRQIDELETAGWGTITNIVATAIDRMYREEQNAVTTYIVSHYHQNPRHNTQHKFTNLKEAQEEFMKMSSDSDTPGASWLEIQGDNESYKTRDWNTRRATVSGKFKRDKQAVVELE